MANQLKIGFIQAKSEIDLDLFRPLFYGYIQAYVEKYCEFPVTMSYMDDLNYSGDFNIIGVSSTSQCFDIAKDLGRKVKERNKNIITIIGGHHITYMPETLTEEFDIGVMGEGEEAFLELTRYFFQNGFVIKPEILRDIKGLVFHHNGSIFITPKRDLIEPLDSIPFPERSDGTTPYLFTSRGCPYKCSFCSSSAFWDKTRYFSAEYVVKEVEHLIEKSPGISNILILDDLFIVNKPRFKRFAELIVEKKINEKVSFVFSVRANLVDDELCENLKRINIAGVAFGAESGSNRILHILRKSTTKDMNQLALDTFYKHKIPVYGSFIVGTPTETEEDVRSTYEFILMNIYAGKLLPRASVNILMPLPGTDIWKQAIQDKLIDQENIDWGRLSPWASYRDSKLESIDEWINYRKKYKSFYLAEDTLPESRLYELMSVYENTIKAIEEQVGFNDLIVDLESQISRLNQTMAERDYQISLLETNVTKLGQWVHELHNSNSWKITAPLRFISARFEGLRLWRRSSLQHYSNKPDTYATPAYKLKKIAVDVRKRHTYEYDINLSLETAPAKVVRMVGHDKRVLEIGAGPGSITRILQQNNGCRITGVEIDSSAIAKLSQFCEAVYQFDLNKTEWTSMLSGCGTYDVIVAADVFEHLYNPQETLTALKPFLASDGYLVVSLPHFGNNAIIASILDGDFEYRDFGLLDRTHIRFFGIKNMQQLIENSGYKIIAAEFVIKPPGQTELASHWRKLLPDVKSMLAKNQYGAVYQVVMKIVPAEATGAAIILTDLSIAEYKTKIMESMKVWLKTYLNKLSRF